MTSYKLDYPNPIIYEAKKAPKQAIIWMHGLGANGNDFKEIIPYLNINSDYTRLVFPNAASQPVTINGGLKMPSWYDIDHPTLRSFDTKGVNETNNYIQHLINEQIKLGISSDKIILAGFSQGGAIAIYSAINCQYKLAGVLALSCYLLQKPNPTSINQHTPILMMHGSEDNIVNYSLADKSRQELTDFGYQIEFKKYSMAHEINLEQINDISIWVSSIFTEHNYDNP